MDLEAIQSQPGRLVGFMVASKKAAITFMGDCIQGGDNFLILMLEKTDEDTPILECRTFAIDHPDHDFNTIASFHGEIVHIDEGGMQEGLIQIVSEHGRSFQLVCETGLTSTPAPGTPQPEEGNTMPAIGFTSVEEAWRRWWKALSRKFSKRT